MAKASKSQKQKRSSSEIESLKSILNIDFLDQLVDFVFAENLILSRRSFRQLNILMDMFELEDFSSDLDKQARVYIIKKLAKKRAETNLTPHFDTLCSLLKGGGKLEEEIDKVLNGVRSNLSNDFITEIDNLVAQRLKYSLILRKTNEMQDTLLAIQNNDYDDLEVFMEENVEPLFGDVYKSLKKVRGLSADSEKDFDLSTESFEEALSKSYTLKHSTITRVKTGIKKLNDMFGGCLEGGRVYNFLGLTGMGKSKILLTIAYHAWKYNQDMKTLDPSLKPAFLYITLENDIYETTERLAALAINMDEYDESSYSEDTDIFRDLELEDIIDNLMKYNGISSDKCNLYIKYRRNRSINMLDVQSMIEDIKMDGYEVRGVIIDYTRRVNSVDKMVEENERLGAITNDFSTLAKENNCFVVSAGQMNRNAMKQLEEMIAKGKQNLGQKLQSSDIGGSWAIIENSDYVVIINPEETLEDDGSIRQWMTFNRVKSRAKKSKTQFFAHPVHSGNSMQLIEDLNERSSRSVDSLADKMSMSDTDKEVNNVYRTRRRDHGSKETSKGNSNMTSSVGSGTRKRKILVHDDFTGVEQDQLASQVAAQDKENL